MKNHWGRAAVGFLLLLSACTIGSGSPITFTQVRVPTLNSYGSFDAIEVDQKAHLLYAADRVATGVDVFDLTTTPATFTHTIELTSSPNGLALAPDLKRIFVGMEDGSVAIIDQHDKVIKEVVTGAKGVDLIDYSPSTHEVYAASPDDSVVATIDGATGAVRHLIKVPGTGLEQPRYNPVDKTLYVVSPGSGGMFALDPVAGTVKRKIDLGGCKGRGIAINTARDEALVACTDRAVRVNLRDTKDQQQFGDVEGGDVVTYDAAADRFLVATVDTIPSGVAVLGGNPLRHIASVHTRSGGNSAALDDLHQMVYTPDVRYGQSGLIGFPLPAGEPPISIDGSAFVELGVVVGFIIVAMFVVGRLADPIRRPEPMPVRRRRRV